MYIRLRVPCVLALSAFASGCGSSKSTGPTTPAGSGLSISFAETQISQGGTATFTINLPSAALGGGLPIVLKLGGIASGADTTTLPPDSSDLPLQGTLGVPNAAPDGTVILTVLLPTLGDSASASLVIQDTQQPTLTVDKFSSSFKADFQWYSEPFGMLIGGTTDTLLVTAMDNHALGWVGWTIAGASALGDSVQVTGDSTTVTFPIAVPISLDGTTVGLHIFARDADNNPAAIDLPQVYVTSITTHPVQSVPRGGRITDVAFDSTRGLLYLAKPDSQSISILSLSTLTYQTPIVVSGAPVALDLSPGGDSLIVGLSSPAQAAVVSLSSAAHPVLGVLSFDTVTADSLRAMRVMSDNNAIALVTRSTTSYAPLYELVMSLSTGVSQASDSGEFGDCPLRMARSGDRAHAVAPNCGGGGGSVVYSSATHAFTGGVYDEIIWGNNILTSGSHSGDALFQIGHSLVDTASTPLTSAGDPWYGAVIAPNANDYYIGEAICPQIASANPCPDSVPGLYFHYQLSRLPQLTPIEIAIIPHPAYELAITPSATTLVGITADSISVIDLTHSTPASGAQVARLRRLARRSSSKANASKPAHRVSRWSLSWNHAR